jgi:hypothetical protein
MCCMREIKEPWYRRDCGLIRCAVVCGCPMRATVRVPSLHTRAWAQCRRELRAWAPGDPCRSPDGGLAEP